MKKIEVPVWQKKLLTIEEAAVVYNIGTAKLYELTNDDRCKFVLYVGTKRLIKVKEMDAFISTQYSI